MIGSLIRSPGANQNCQQVSLLETCYQSLLRPSIWTCHRIMTHVKMVGSISI